MLAHHTLLFFVAGDRPVSNKELAEDIGRIIQF